MPKCSVANAPIDRPTTCARCDAERVEHAADVVARARLRVALEVLGHVGGRIAARVVGDAAVAAREVAHLRLPAAVVAGELVHEDDRRAAAGLLVVQLDAVVGVQRWHVAFYVDESGCSASSSARPNRCVIEDLPSPRAGPGEVVISVKAASVNFPDVLIIQNKYQFKPPLPFSPGSELAGVVKEVGDGVHRLQAGRPGDRVHHLRRLRRGSEDRGRAAACRCREGMDFVTRRGVPAHLRHLRPRAARPRRAARRARRCWCSAPPAASASPRSRSARRSARASSPAPRARTSSRSAASTAPTPRINYATEDLRERIKALTDGKRRGRGLRRRGRPLHASRRSARIAWRGRLLVVGFAAGEIPKLPLNLALLKGASIVGVFWGDFARREPKQFAESVRQLGKWYAEGQAEAARVADLSAGEGGRGAEADGRAAGEGKGRPYDVRLASSPAQGALHDHAVDPAAELEAHRAQRADAQEAAGSRAAPIDAALALSPITAMIWR